MQVSTEYDAFMFNYIKRFKNITFIDPSITIEDLWSEAYMIYAKLLNSDLSCSFITALGNQIEQRFTDMYRVAKRLNNNLDRNQFIDNLSNRTVKVSRLQFEELPFHMKTLVKRIYENPEKFAEMFPKNNINKSTLIKFLTKELNWKRKNAFDFASYVTTSRREPCLDSFFLAK
jgi:hypothetical protein